MRLSIESASKPIPHDQNRPLSIHSYLFAMLLISLLPSVHADDLGVVWPTYDMAEPDLLEVIQSRLNLMEKSGELAKK